MKRILPAVGVLAAVIVLLLLLVFGPISKSPPANGTPKAACTSAVWSPVDAPSGSHFFGDGAPLLGLTAEQTTPFWKAAGHCDPFQISVREMEYGFVPRDENARFKRQQQLAGDMDELTKATRRIEKIADESSWTLDTNWTGHYETLFAVYTADGWHAHRLTKPMTGEVVLVQHTKGGRTFLWKVKCLFQPVARSLPGYPASPPSNPAAPPTTGGHNPPHYPPPHNPPSSVPPTTWKCQGVEGICGSPNSGHEQQPVQDNDPGQVAPTPGYTPGSAENGGGTQGNCAGQAGCNGVDSGGGGGSSPGGSGTGSNGGTGTNAGTGNVDHSTDPNPGSTVPAGSDPGGF